MVAIGGQSPRSNTTAADWWNEYGCPERKALAATVMEQAAM